MSVKWTVELSPESFKELADKVRQLPRVFEEASKEAIDEISEEKVKELNDENYHFEKKPTATEGNTVIGGFKSNTQEDLYTEFGTGIIGQENPHPESNGYTTSHDIRRYNLKTGQVEDITGSDYWVYENNGEFYSTRGRPAKKKVYESVEEIEETLSDRISQKIDEKLKELS